MVLVLVWFVYACAGLHVTECARKSFKNRPKGLVLWTGSYE